MSVLPSDLVTGHEGSLRSITPHHNAKYTPKTITLHLSYGL